MFVFTCGLIVCIAGVFRMIYLQRYFTNIDLLWDAALTTSMGIVEVNIGIVCGSLPCIKPLLTKLLPTLFGSTERTKWTTPSGKAAGPLYQFNDLSGHHASKGEATSVSRVDQFEVMANYSGSDGASTHSLAEPVSDHNTREHLASDGRNPSTLPKNGIMVNHTVTVERSWASDV